MSLKNQHPQFQSASYDWTLMRDAYTGERKVKSKAGVYLPPTSSQIADGAYTANTDGARAYSSYILRARFPNFVREAIGMAIGMMDSQPPEIKLPKALENVRSARGEDLRTLLRKINTEQLLTGRCGLLADLATNPAPGEDIPYICLYEAESIINWDDGELDQNVPQKLNLVVLDESSFRRKEFTWEQQTKLRVLQLGALTENEQSASYFQGIFEDDTYSSSKMKKPSWRGRTLDFIPFSFINSCDVAADVDQPPLLDLGNLCMTIYRGDADYRQNLYMQGQDTLVTVGAGFDEGDKVKVGVGARIDLPMGGTASYVGVNSNGLSEQREALQNLEARAGSMGAQTLDSTSRERESGDSLRIRVAARTADMNQIAEAGALGLQDVLRSIAKWMGEDPSEVSVRPNKEFGDLNLSGQSMVEMATARNAGFPISAKSLHDLARKRKITALTYEEEIAEAEKEEENSSFPFAKASTADMATSQPNANPNDGKSKDEKQKPAK